SQLLVHRDKGYGAAVMVNSDNGQIISRLFGPRFFLYLTRGRDEKYSARPALRRANAIKEPWLHFDRCADTGARHRSEHGYFQRSQRRVAQTAALPRAGKIGTLVREQPDPAQIPVGARQLSELSRAERHARRPGALYAARCGIVERRQTGAAGRAGGDCRVL